MKAIIECFFVPSLPGENGQEGFIERFFEIGAPCCFIREGEAVRLLQCRRRFLEIPGRIVVNALVLVESSHVIAYIHGKIGIGALFSHLERLLKSLQGFLGLPETAVVAGPGALEHGFEKRRHPFSIKGLFY